MSLLSAKNSQNSLTNVEDIASQSRIVFETVYSMTKKIKFLGCMFPHVVQKHKLEKVDNKSPFDSIITQQYLFQKLPKSVDVH